VADAPWLSEGGESEDEPEQAGACPWVGAEEEGELPSDDVHTALADANDADPHAGVALGQDSLDDPDADPHAGVRVASAGVSAPSSPVRRSDAGNGVSIAELYARRTQLAEHAVRVRGVVVKRTDGILNQTYLHLRDGSGSAALADQDLTLTTNQEFELGEEVEVEGRVIVDRDLGLGYQYPVLLEASVRVGPRG
jgi:hypothetical protein